MTSDEKIIEELVEKVTKGVIEDIKKSIKKIIKQGISNNPSKMMLKGEFYKAQPRSSEWAYQYL
jgi:hypothetical protein